jgi:O-antigen ligase
MGNKCSLPNEASADSPQYSLGSIPDLMAKPHRKSATAVFDKLQSRRARLIAFLTLFALIALFGGASRADVASLVVLRPLAILLGGYALLVMPQGQLRDFRALLAVVAAAFVAVGWQLIPLPPTIWSSLPMREPVVALDGILDVHVWRPAALSPDGAWNALFSLFVPSAALLSYIALDPQDRPALLPAVCCFALFSALLGIMQVLGDPNGVLFFYAITNDGLPVGLFSNRNHHAILLVCAMPILGLWASRRADRAKWILPATLAAEAVLLTVVLLTGSRAGLITAVIAIVATVWVMAFRQKAVPVPGAKPLPWRGPRLLAAIGAAIAVVVASLLVFGRALAVQRLLATDPETEIRVTAFPEVMDMLRETWLVGVGPGSFPAAFAIVEPVAMLGPNYLNHAHNDWLELPVELGIPGLVVLAWSIGLVLLYARRLIGARRVTRGERAAVLAPPAIFAAASLGDYPLRTPSLAVVALLWLAAMANVPERILPASSRRQS